MEKSIYAQIGQRTGGDIYIGVVGPVRTGKSTLVKRIMETLVLPNIPDPYRRERARDELPQSGSGRTIMTAEPKFVPEEAVEVSPDGVTQLRVRMIDSVGYVIPGATGATEDGKDRMIVTPWADTEIPMTQAAELGTKKVMAEHCTVGFVVTTDGSVTDIPRQDYVEAEGRAVADMLATGKPFLVIVNSKDPQGEAARAVADSLRQTHGVQVRIMDCQSGDLEDVSSLLGDLLGAFPMGRLEVHFPRWLDALEWEHPVKKNLCDALKDRAEQIHRLSQAPEILKTLEQVEPVQRVETAALDPGTGTVCCRIQLPEELYYDILTQRVGVPIRDQGALMELLTELVQTRAACEQFVPALEQARSTGYGIVLPTRQDMKLETPELTKKGSVHGVRIRASAPSIHMLRVDLETEISPMVGSEQQAKELVATLGQEFGENPSRLWESHIFGKTVYEMVSDSMDTRLRQYPEEVRLKFRSSLSKTVNEGASGMICILF